MLRDAHVDQQSRSKNSIDLRTRVRHLVCFDKSERESLHSHTVPHQDQGEPAYNCYNSDSILADALVAMDSI